MEDALAAADEVAIAPARRETQSNSALACHLQAGRGPWLQRPMIETQQWTRG
jgi:hypothetical protein